MVIHIGSKILRINSKKIVSLFTNSVKKYNKCIIGHVVILDHGLTYCLTTYLKLLKICIINSITSLFSNKSSAIFCAVHKTNRMMIFSFCAFQVFVFERNFVYSYFYIHLIYVHLFWAPRIY